MVNLYILKYMVAPQQTAARALLTSSKSFPQFHHVHYPMFEKYVNGWNVCTALVVQGIIKAFDVRHTRLGIVDCITQFMEPTYQVQDDIDTSAQSYPLSPAYYLSLVPSISLPCHPQQC